VNKDKHTVDEMQKLLKVNCLHKGDFGSCKGKKWMVAVDGSNSSYLALEETLKLADPVKDHVFVITGTYHRTQHLHVKKKYGLNFVQIHAQIQCACSSGEDQGVEEGQDAGGRRAAQL
jgi:hypothetical protein